MLHKSVTGGRYTYSYVMSQRFDARRGKSVPKVTAVRNPTDKVLLVEEDANTINDGYFSPPTYDDNTTLVNGGGDLLAVRHDRTKPVDDGTSMTVLPNPDLRGNVAFLDGHAEFVPRRHAHNTRNIEPFK